MGVRDIIPIVIGVLLLGYCGWLEWHHVERVMHETRRLLDEHERRRREREKR